MSNKKFTINSDLQSISSAIKDMMNTLQTWKCKSVQVHQAALTMEELLVHIIQGEEKPEKIYLYLNKGLRKTSAKIIYRGKQFDLSNCILLPGDNEALSEYDPTAENVIHEMILRLMSDRISVKYDKGVNTIRVVVEKNDKAPLIDTVIAMLLAIVGGIALRLTLPEEGSQFIASNLLQPLYFIFLRAMQLIMAPLIFFSLASSILGLNDLRSLGRTGAKMMSVYMLTTMIAILVTIGVDALMLPGAALNIALPEAGAASMLGDVPEISPSIKTMIINLMPNNFLGTFVASDMLQIIVLAIISAIAAGNIGKYSSGMKTAIETMNSFFGKLTAGITRFLPLAIFGSFGNMVLTLDVSSFGSLVYWGLAATISLSAMAGVYCLLILIFGRLNPLVFVRKFFKASLTAFSSSSSSAAMPTSMECCRNMGVSPSIYSFSIPLGCTVNMDGTAIMFMSVTMFLARIYGIELDSGTMVSVISMVMLLSLAMPGVPGAAIAGFLSILAIAGVPTEGLTIVLGFCSLIELQTTATNVTGDGAVTTVVAKSEGQLDVEQYYQ